MEKKKIWKRWWFWVIVVIVIGVIGSLGGSNSDSDTPSKISNEKSQQSVEKKEVSKESKEKVEETEVPDETFYVGDEITMGAYVLTVDKVKHSSGTQYDKPKKGKEFLIVTVTLKNNGEDEFDYNPYNFSVQDSNGSVTDITFTTVDSDTSLEAGSLVSGGKVSGTLAFEVPKNDKKTVLRYQPDFWSDKEIQINLNKKK